MFGYRHYVPILRWRAAEKAALRELKPEDKTIITPLIEITMPQLEESGNKTPAELLQESISTFLQDVPKVASQLLKYWDQGALFLDVQLIDSSIRAKALKEILDHGKQLNLLMVPVGNVIPVVGFASDEQTRQVAVDFAKETRRGLCFRITESNFNETSLVSDIEDFVSRNGLETQNIDLMVDFKIINEQTSLESLQRKIEIIPRIEQWRTFTIASGAFPPDLSHIEKHEQRDIPRLDWTMWCSLSGSLKRPPSFSDYSIQHPVYAPKSSASNPSASIRYALEDRWVIIRGEGLRNPKGAGFKQYPALAQILVKQKDIFKGDGFSFGDSYIADKAKDINTKNTGNPQTWLEAGINHHLTLVARQVAAP